MGVRNILISKVSLRLVLCSGGSLQISVGKFTSHLLGILKPLISQHVVLSDQPSRDGGVDEEGANLMLGCEEGEGAGEAVEEGVA